jgi:lipopolysaccharide transport system permease protein
MFISKAHLVEVFFTKLAFNLKSEAAKTYLSYAWWLFEPVLTVTIYYVVFAVFLSTKTPDFVIFLVCGQIPFLWFSKSVTNSSNSIVAGRGLINQVSIPKPFFPMLVVFQDAFKQIIVFTFMFTLFAVYGLEVSWVWLNTIFVILSQLLLIAAISLLVAAITPFLPDFKFLVATGMMGLMFGSGIFYDYKTTLLPEHQQIFLMNPMASLINNYRLILIDNSLPDWNALADICLFSFIVIVAMALFFRKTDKLYARLIAQ